MKLNFNVIVAAAVLAVAGSANAALDGMTNAGAGSSLVFIAYDRTGTATGSFMADLGYNLGSFLPSSAINNPGTAISWNFSTNAINVTGNAAAAAQPVGASVDFSTAFDTFKSTVQAGELRWAVIAGESDLQQFITTGAPIAANLADTGTTRQTNQVTSNMVNVDNMYILASNAGSHGTADNGANFSLPSESTYFARNGANFFGQNGNWNNALRWNAVLANGDVSRLFFVNNVPRAGVGDTAEITTYGLGNPMAPLDIPSLADASTFAFDINTNSLTYVAAVPEASTLAMLLAGLGAVGLMARRRRAG